MFPLIARLKARAAVVALLAVVAVAVAAPIALAAAPTATTGPSEAALSSGQATVTLRGEVDPNGVATTYRFKYRAELSDPYVELSQRSAGEGTDPVAVARAVPGLDPNEVYHYKLFSTNADGSGRGLSFATVVTGDAAALDGGARPTPSGARLTGAVNPNGKQLRWYFEYGTTTSYGSTTEVKGFQGGRTDEQVATVIGPLEEETTYHYRLVTETAAGISYGADKTFTTAGVRPRVIEAESFPVPAGAYVASNPEAGDVLAFTDPGATARDFRTRFGYNRIAVRARGTKCDGERPWLTVALDGADQIHLPVGDAWRTQSVHLFAPAGTHTVQIGFTDPAGGCDRNLFVDKVVLADGPIRPRPTVLADLQLESAPFFREGDWTRLQGPDNPSGAVGLNALWEDGEYDRFNVSLQRRGEQNIIGGVVTRNTNEIDRGLRMFAWGFSHQAADGTWPENIRPVHGVPFFVQAVSHALLVLEQSEYGPQYLDEIADMRWRIHRAAHWLVRPEVLQEWQDYNGGGNHSGCYCHYTHQYFLLASALGLTAKLTGDDSLIPHARRKVRDGLDLQDPAGWFNEKEGWDSGYQGPNLVFAGRWLRYFSDDPLAPALEQAMWKGVEWEESRVEPNGRIITEGNTRSCADEFGNPGELKTPQYGVVTRGIAYWAAWHNRQDLDDLARLIDAYRMSGEPHCDSDVESSA